MEKDLSIMRHSAAHLLAAAVLKLFKGTKLGIGPSIKNGFYYDFDFTNYREISHEFPRIDDLPRIEEKMKEIREKDLKFEKKLVSKKEAEKIFKNQPYKLELVKEIGEGRVSIYKTGDFIDLCKGPHKKSTKEIGSFKLLSIAGAYWRGSETNPMLLRIYGTCFEKGEELEKYLKQLEEAKKRDHRKLGAELDLFSFHKEAPGMVFFHPKGQILYQILENFSQDIQKKYNYQEVICPNMLNVEVWKRSGHWQHYKEAMYFVKEDFALRPMDCPGAILIYKTQTRSYKELPMRLSEFGVITRKELSGTLHGLFRLQQFTQDDAHIFLREDQIEEEIGKIIKLTKEVYQKFDLPFLTFLSMRPANFMGKIETWDKAENALKQALKNNKIEFQENPGEGAFYGPKIDFHLEDVLGRTWQCGTIQLDFQMPEKFDLEYIDKDGKAKRPVIIHRTILGSIERFIGILLEHTGGNLPFWLSPIQVVILPIASRHLAYAKVIGDRIFDLGFRREIDQRNETLEKKIRDWEIQKVPYMLVVGDKEIKNKKVALRDREKGDLGQIDLTKFLKMIK